jgi:acyl-CoA hydrolase
MEAEVKVFSEDPVNGEKKLTNTAYLVYVAVDQVGKPAKVPGLILEREKEKQRFIEGKARQEHRLSRR